MLDITKTIDTSISGPLEKPALRSRFNLLSLEDGDLGKLFAVATELGAQYIQLPPISDKALGDFIAANAGKEPLQNALKSIAGRLRKETDAAVARYDVEYGTWQYPPFRAAVIDTFGNESTEATAIEGAYLRDTNYCLTSPLLESGGFTRISGLGSLPSFGLIADIGCGNCQLLKNLQSELRISADRLRGIDISSASVSLVRQLGIEGFTGTLPAAVKNKWIEAQQVSALFLSYFVDRDSDQQATFSSAKAAVMPEGLVILEGLFPVKSEDSLGTRYADDTSKLVTRGKSAADDVLRVTRCFRSLGFQLQRVVAGERLVFSLDGFEILPSIFLVFKKEA